MLISFSLHAIAALLRSQVAPRAPARSSSSAVIDTVTSNLRDAVRLILILAALLAIGALVAGNTWVRAKVGDMGKPGWATGGPVHRVGGPPTGRWCSGWSWPSAC